MLRFVRGSGGSVSVMTCVLAACASAPPTEAPRSPAGAPSVVVAPPQSAPSAATGMYGVDEALRDALQGPWEYVGTGPWPGINRMQACAFRNDRVWIVNAYCTLTEQQAFRVDIYSPTRGRVRVYAEAEGPISERTRPDFFTFTAQTEPPPAPSVGLPALTLAMSFDALRAYDDRRYGAFLPVCYGGVEMKRRQGGCLGTLAPREAEWSAHNGAFLERASDDFYRLVRNLKALAAQHGREPGDFED